MTKLARLFIIAIAALCCDKLRAQTMPYFITYDTATYVPLTGGTSINDTIVWDSSYVAGVPLGTGFTFTIGGTTAVSNFFLAGGTDMLSDTNRAASFSDFTFEDAYFVDRGELVHATQSPIRYTVTGTTGSRIFKAEIFNAGFQDELDLYGTLNDSASVQVWLYEGSNIIEYRYGPSSITHSSDYFWNGGPDIGYSPSTDTGGSGTFYLCEGTPTPTPPYPAYMTVDTLSTVFTQGLTSFPPNGTVYRFNPIPLSVKDAGVAEGVRVYPTICTDEVKVDYTGADVMKYSIVTINGVSMASGGLVNGTTSIDISSLPPGMYLVLLQGSGGKQVQKFIKM